MFTFLLPDFRWNSPVGDKKVKTEDIAVNNNMWETRIYPCRGLTLLNPLELSCYIFSQLKPDCYVDT